LNAVVALSTAVKTAVLKVILSSSENNKSVSILEFNDL